MEEVANKKTCFSGQVSCFHYLDQRVENNKIYFIFLMVFVNNLILGFSNF